MRGKLMLIVSVYRKDDWSGGLVHGQGPVHEMPFSSELHDVADSLETSYAMRRCARFCEEWLRGMKVTLKSFTVVTVYDLEVYRE